MVFIRIFNGHKHIFRQILLTSVGVLQGICAGGMFGFTSILFTQLRYDNSISLNTQQESWIASIPTLIMFPACLLNCWMLETFGRKVIIIGVEIIALSSWITLFFANSYATLLIPRILLGIFAGCVYPTIITLLGEVSAPAHRTLFTTAVPFGSTIGILLCQILGEYVHWKLVAAIFAFLPFYDLLICLYVRESYVTLLDRNRLDDAKRAFVWYRGDDAAAINEWDAIVEDKRTRGKESFVALIRMCADRAFLHPLGITTLVFLTNEFTATQAVSFYTGQIIRMITDNSTFAFYATLVLNVLRMAAMVLSSFIVKATSVRFTLLASGYLLAGSLIVLASFMYLCEVYLEYASFPIITLCIFVLNTVLYGIGLGPLPSVVCAEMFPQSTRSIGGSISASLSFLFLFIVVKFMPVLFTQIGPYWTFSIFAICTLLGISVCHVVLPNTKNKTLQEINQLFHKESKDTTDTEK